MRLAIALCLVVLPSAVRAESLRGQWEIRIPSQPAYTGTALVDAEGRTTWDDGYGRGWRGYVADAGATKVEFVITSGAAVARIHCTIQSSDLLHCKGRYTDGRVIENLSVLTRVGPGPATLMSVLPSRSN